MRSIITKAAARSSLLAKAVFTMRACSMYKKVLTAVSSNIEPAMPSRYFEANTSFAPARGLLAFSGLLKPFAPEVAIMSLFSSSEKSKKPRAKNSEISVPLKKLTKLAPAMLPRLAPAVIIPKNFLLESFEKTSFKRLYARLMIKRLNTLAHM